MKAELPNGIVLEYDTLGDPNNEAIILIQGLGAQMILWETGLMEKFVAQNYYVIRFDNRDIGLSTHLTESPPTKRLCRILCKYLCCCFYPSKCCGRAKVCALLLAVSEEQRNH